LFIEAVEIHRKLIASPIGKISPMQHLILPARDSPLYAVIVKSYNLPFEKQSLLNNGE